MTEPDTTATSAPSATGAAARPTRRDVRLAGHVRLSPARDCPPRSGHRHARILGVGGYRPERVVTNDEIVRARSTPPTSGSASAPGIVSRRWAATDESVIDMAEAAARKALERAGLTGADIDAVLVATVTHLYQTPSAAAAARATGSAPRRPRPSTSPRPAPASATASRWPTTWSAAARARQRARHRRREALRLHRPATTASTAFIFGDGAGAVVVGPSRRPRASARPSGAPTAPSGTRSQQEPRGSSTATTRTREWPALTMEGQPVFRWAVWQMAPVAQKALDAAGVTADDLDAFIPHQANMRIIDAMVKQLRAAGARRRSPATSRRPATPRRRRSRSRWSGCSRTARRRSGGLALLIGFGAGLAYAAQVVVLP